MSSVSVEARRWYAEALGWDLVPVWGIGPGGECGCGVAGCVNAGKHRAEVWDGTPWEVWPSDLNLGVQYAPNGVVVSVDVHREGNRTIEALEIEAGSGLRLTWTVRTGKHYDQHAWHRYFRLPVGVTGADLRTFVPGYQLGVKVVTDTYTIVPPSLHVGGETYTWHDELRPGGAGGLPAPAELPAAIVDALRLGVSGSLLPKGPVVGTMDWSDATRIGRLSVSAQRQELKNTAIELFKRFGESRLETATWLFRLAELCGMDADVEEHALLSYIANAEQEARKFGVTRWTTGGAGVGGSGGSGGSGGGGAGGISVPAGDPDSLGPDGTPGRRTPSENGNARRLVDYFGGDVRFTPELEWFRWDDLTWRPDVRALNVLKLTRELPALIVGEIANYPPGMAPGSPAGAELFEHAERSRSASFIKKAIELAMADERVHVGASVWDSDADLVGVSNGVVNLRTGKLVPPARDQYITKRTACPFEAGARDTRFSIWLDQVTGGDKELQAWLQRWAGYCLTAETREEKFIMLYGPAGTGKSTFLELVKAAAGDYGLTLQAENIMAQKFGKTNEEYYNAQIMGKRVIVISELLEAEAMKEDSVKRLTGADSMVGRHPNGRPLQFKSQAKLMIGTNNRPYIKDNAMWRRLRLVPFTHVPVVMDQTLKPYLLDPEGGLGAFLAWAVEGAVAWYMHGLGSCSVVDEATEEYKKNEDELGIFLEEELRQGEGTSVAMTDVHTAWKFWLEDRGGKSTGGPINRLMRALGDRGLDVDGTGRRARLLGWALQPRSVPDSSSTSWGELVDRASTRPS